MIKFLYNVWHHKYSINGSTYILSVSSFGSYLLSQALECRKFTGEVVPGSLYRDEGKDDREWKETKTGRINKNVTAVDS